MDSDINLILIHDDYLCCKDFKEDKYVYHNTFIRLMVDIFSYIREVRCQLKRMGKFGALDKDIESRLRLGASQLQFLVNEHLVLKRRQPHPQRWRKPGMQTVLI